MRRLSVLTPVGTSTSPPAVSDPCREARRYVRRWVSETVTRGEAAARRQAHRERHARLAAGDAEPGDRRVERPAGVARRAGRGRERRIRVGDRERPVQRGLPGLCEHAAAVPLAGGVLLHEAAAGRHVGRHRVVAQRPQRRTLVAAAAREGGDEERGREWRRRSQPRLAAFGSLSATLRCAVTPSRVRAETRTFTRSPFRSRRAAFAGTLNASFLLRSALIA